MPIATTVEEAAFNHLQVFTQPVQAWPPELQARIPPFEALYVDPTGEGGAPGPIATMARKLERIAGPSKFLLTGQRGSGKSWALHHLRTLLSPTFRVIEASATDYTGVTVPEAEVADVLLLLGSALARSMANNWQADAFASAALIHWVEQLNSLDALPKVPDRAEHYGVELSAFFAKLTARMRSDTESRALIRKVGAEDLLVVVNAMIDALAAAGPPVVVLFDDLDKVDIDLARKLFSEQMNTIARVRAKMVLTLPFAVALDTRVALPLTVLKNVQVFARQGSRELLPQALHRFVELVSRLLNPALVDGRAVELAVLNSAGIPREFGRLLARAFENAALSGADHVELAHAEDAVREMRIELLRATQDGARREALIRVHTGGKLVQPMDRELIHDNLVVEYVDGTPWYDVHPLIASAVDEWNASG